MAIEVQISKNIDNNYVQVDTKSTRTGIHHYKVPNENSDEFCASYKKLDKKRKVRSDFAFFGAVIIGSAIANILTKNYGKAINTIAMIGSGLGVGFLTDIASRKIFDKKQDKLLAQFKAQEIELNQGPKISDLIK